MDKPMSWTKLLASIGVCLGIWAGIALVAILA